MNQIKEETKLKFHKVKPYLTPPNQDFFETSDQLNTSWLVRLSVARLLWTDLKLLYVSSVIRLVLNTKSLWKDNAYYATILKVQTLSSIHLPVTIVCYIQHRKRCFHICVIKKKSEALQNQHLGNCFGLCHLLH